MIDRNYIKHLTKNLCFELNEEQTSKIIIEIQELDKKLEQYSGNSGLHNYSPVNGTRVVNCAKLRKDIITKPLDKDYLSNAKKADKYVVGK